MKYLVPTILITLVVVSLGLAFYVVTRPVQQVIGMVESEKTVIISDVVIPENDAFANFYDMWAAIDILNQIYQGEPYEIKGSDGFINKADKELKKLKVKEYKYKVVNSDGVIVKEKTKQVN